MEYKDSKDISPNFLANMRIMKSANDASSLDDDTILSIQSVFFGTLCIDPQIINEEAQDIFNNLEKIVSSDICMNILPHIIPFSVYQQLVNFMAKLNDGIAHNIISRIIVALTNDISKSLEELLKCNILEAVDRSIANFDFPQSAHLVFQIIANYLSDPDEEISAFFHKKYKLEYLFKLFQYIKATFSQNPELDEDYSLQREIAIRWMKCIYITISRYPKDIVISHATIVLIEIQKYFDIIFHDPVLCKHLCFSITTLIDEGCLNFSDFNLYRYPEFISELSHVPDEEVRAYAFSVAGKLIQFNRYCVEFNFMDYFNVILEANDQTLQLLLSAAFYVCRCCLENRIIAQETFETVSANMPQMFDFYENQNFNLRSEMIVMFAAYVKYFAELKYDAFPQFGSIVLIITGIFFDNLPLLDDFNSIYPILESLILLNNYFIDYKYINADSISQYVTGFIDCMSELQKNEDKNISVLTERMLNSLNEEQKFQN